MVKSFRDQYMKPGDKVLDVGSFNVNGCHRDLLPGFDYTGIDIRPGPNVDLVVEPYAYPFPDGSFDIVISGQCIEHSPHPWKVVNEIGRLVKPGGFVLITAPWTWEIHRYPLDCFRILPDGLSSMMVDAGLKVLACNVIGQDTFGIGTK
jgi:SAM-dependent methyltransferase